MIFETVRLLLRNYTSEDWERVHIYGSSADFCKFEVWGPNTLEDTHKFVGDMVAQAQSQPRYEFELAVIHKPSNLLIGGCGICRESELSKVASMGWAINPEFQSQGFATEAARALIEFGFEKLQLSVIYATCDTRNVPSVKVMEKLGMKRVGMIKGTKQIKGHIRDSYRYELERR